MFSPSKCNYKLMWTPQLPLPRHRSGISNDLTLNSSLIFGMCKSPWLFLIISCLRIFSMTHTHVLRARSLLGLRKRCAQTLLLWWITQAVCVSARYECLAALYLHCHLQSDAIKHNKCILVLFILYDSHLAFISDWSVDSPLTDLTQVFTNADI